MDDNLIKQINDTIDNKVNRPVSAN